MAWSISLKNSVYHFGVIIEKYPIPFVIVAMTLTVVYAMIVSGGFTKLIFVAIISGMMALALAFVVSMTIKYNATFPTSTHTASAVALCTVASIYDIRLAPIMVILAVLTGMGRVKLDKHTVTEVFNGAALGFVCGVLGVLFCRKILLL